MSLEVRQKEFDEFTDEELDRFIDENELPSQVIVVNGKKAQVVTEISRYGEISKRFVPVEEHHVNNRKGFLAKLWARITSVCR